MIWLQSYLTLRSQYVVVDGCSSSKTTSLHFICEWHIPVSFLLNFIHHPICWWYILLLCPFKSSFEISLAQSNVYILFSWVKSNHLTINHSNTKYMIISKKSSTSFHTLPSHLFNGLPLELVSSFKYLSVTLTFNLSLSTYINETCSKVKKLLGYIYFQIYYNSSSVLLKLYLTLILPVFMYSSSVWDPYSICNINKLEKFNTLS